jgi:hypothetical protein
MTGKSASSLSTARRSCVLVTKSMGDADTIHLEISKAALEISRMKARSDARDMDDSNPLGLLDHLRLDGVVRTRDVKAIGVPRKCLSRLVERGQAEPLGRGLSMAAETEREPHHSLAAVAAQVPHGVVRLLSALLFHEPTIGLPKEAWPAIAITAWRPQLAPLPVHIVRFWAAAFSGGAEDHVIEGVPVHITNPAKTMVDCFKFRPQDRRRCDHRGAARLPPRGNLKQRRDRRMRRRVPYDQRDAALPRGRRVSPAPSSGTSSATPSHTQRPCGRRSAQRGSGHESVHACTSQNLGVYGGAHG